MKRSLRDTPADVNHPLSGRWYVLVENKPYGPYEGFDLVDFLDSKQINESDLVRHEDSSSWVPLSADPVLGHSFAKKASPRKSGPSTSLKFARRASAALFFLFVFSAFWIAWPYYTLYRISVALRQGDEITLEEFANWDSLRQGLRGDLNALFLKHMSTESGSVATGLATALGPAVINQMVDGYVTPQGLARLIRTGRPPTANSAATANAGGDGIAPKVGERRPIDDFHKHVKYAFFSGGPFRFLVLFQPDNAPSLQPMTMILTWDGTWKLSRLQLPIDDDVAVPNPVSPTSNESAKTDRFSQKAQSVDHSAVWGTSFKSQVERCWKKPSIKGKAGIKIEANVTIRLKPDGRLESDPKITSPTAGLGAYEFSALSAINACQPYSLPDEHYEEWKYFEASFTETSPVR